MKIAALLSSPLKEAFSLIGVDYTYPLEMKDFLYDHLDEEVSLLVLPAEFEHEFKKRYPDKIIVGV
ncbi:MAG: hypothetical protein KKF44_10265 [Nanoarchaeota archaeon]|nr:hypothetical protein [Nanoarchaeota archaeon]